MSFSGFKKLKTIVLLVIPFLVLLLSMGHARELFNRRTPIVVAVENVGPAVVNIYTKEVVSYQNPFGGSRSPLFDNFFRYFFQPQDTTRRSLGSGVIINSDGYILTNQHVVSRATEIKVTLIDKREYDARLVGADAKADLAVIKIESDEELPFVKMARSDDLMIGESVLAIGNPFGLQHTVTTGIISALNRTIKGGDKRDYHGFIQLDASINPGNSGGPLLNINGDLIGINTAIYQKAEGIGFAIPIGKAKRIVKDLIRFGKVRVGWFGLSVQNIDKDVADYFNLKQAGGVLISRVFKGSPAQKAGLKAGDILLKLGNLEIADRADYWERIYSYPVDHVVEVSYLRNGQSWRKKVRLTSIPKSFMNRFSWDWLGVKVEALKVDRRRRRVSNVGVVVTRVDPNGVCGEVGMVAGDVIRQINQTTIRSEDEFNKAIMEAGKRESVLLLVQRGAYGYYVTLEP